MNRRITSLLKRLEPYVALAAALSCFFLALVLLLFRLHDLGLLAVFFAILLLFFGSLLLVGYLLNLQKH